jgi:glycosyltransferase involved in cell wall biosynthesis
VSHAAARQLRIAACATHPIQYQVPIWRALAATPGFEFKAFFGSDIGARGYRDEGFGTHVRWDNALTSGYDYKFLSTDPGIERIGAWTPNARGLGREFDGFRPDVVILTAYGAGFHLGALAAARRVGARVVMRHEASDVAVARSSVKGALRNTILRVLYRRVDRFATIGIEARRHLLRLGVAAERIDRSPYCVDSDFFDGEVRRWAPRRNDLRQKWGIEPSDIVLVFSGKLIPKKDPLLIPAAVRRLLDSVRRRIHLLVAGDGELRPVMETACRESLGSRARFAGFLNQSELGSAYVAGDLLVLPSRRGSGETWGLVVNEGMQFGLPAIVSDGVGCCADLIDETCGAVFPSGDCSALARAIEDWAERIRQETSAVRRAAAAKAGQFSLQAATEGLKACVLAAATDHAAR